MTCQSEAAVGKAHALLLTDEGVIYSWTFQHVFFENIACVKLLCF